MKTRAKCCCFFLVEKFPWTSWKRMRTEEKKRICGNSFEWFCNIHRWCNHSGDFGQKCKRKMKKKLKPSERKYLDAIDPILDTQHSYEPHKNRDFLFLFLSFYRFWYWSLRVRFYRIKFQFSPKCIANMWYFLRFDLKPFYDHLLGSSTHSQTSNRQFLFSLFFNRYFPHSFKFERLKWDG